MFEQDEFVEMGVPPEGAQDNPLNTSFAEKGSFRKDISEGSCEDHNAGQSLPRPEKLNWKSKAVTFGLIGLAAAGTASLVFRGKEKGGIPPSPNPAVAPLEKPGKGESPRVSEEPNALSRSQPRVEEVVLRAIETNKKEDPNTPLSKVGLDANNKTEKDLNEGSKPLKEASIAADTSSESKKEKVLVGNESLEEVVESLSVAPILPPKVEAITRKSPVTPKENPSLQEPNDVVVDSNAPKLKETTSTAKVNTKEEESEVISARTRTYSSASKLPSNPGLKQEGNKYVLYCLGPVNSAPYKINVDQRAGTDCLLYNQLKRALNNNFDVVYERKMVGYGLDVVFNYYFHLRRGNSKTAIATLPFEKGGRNLSERGGPWKDKVATWLKSTLNGCEEAKALPSATSSTRTPSALESIDTNRPLNLTYYLESSGGLLNIGIWSYNNKALFNALYLARKSNLEVQGTLRFDASRMKKELSNACVHEFSIRKKAEKDPIATVSIVGNSRLKSNQWDPLIRKIYEVTKVSRPSSEPEKKVTVAMRGQWYVMSLEKYKALRKRTLEARGIAPRKKREVK